MKKGIKAVSLTLLLVLFGVLTFFTKPKAKADPIELLEISSVSGWYDFYDQIKHGTTYSTVKLMADLNFDSENQEISPIGTDLIPFTGLFDGNNHTITGKIDLYNSVFDNTMAGLFVTTDNATIKNLNLNLSYDYGVDLSDTNNFDYVLSDTYKAAGTLIGEANNTQVENCKLLSSTLIVNHFDDNSFNLGYVGGLVAKADSCIFKDCKITNSSIAIQMQYVNGSNGFSLYVGGFVGFSNDCTYENCSVINHDDFIELDVMNSKIFDIYIGGFIGGANGENELYHCDLLYDQVAPVVELKNSAASNPGSTYNIGGFLGTANYTDDENFKGNLVTSSIVSDFGLSYHDTKDEEDENDVITYYKEATINIGGVIGENYATSENNPLITVINSAINSSFSPFTSDKAGKLAGIDNGNGIYYDVYSSNLWYLDNFGGEGSAKQLRELDIYHGDFVTDDGAIANGYATYENILNYNALQNYGPSGSTYKNDPTKVKADFDATGTVVGRHATPYTLADLCRTVEYYYSADNHPTKTWIVGSDAQINYDTTVTYDHYEFAEGNVWYTDNTYATAADLEEIEASATTLIVYPKLQVKSDTITFDLTNRTTRNTPTESATISYEGLALNEEIILPVSTGFTFDGYYVYVGGEPTICIVKSDGTLDKTNATYFTDGKWTYAQDLTLKAKWTAKLFTINYDIDGGDGTAPIQQEITYSDNITATVKTYNGNKEGYSRNGWKYTIGTETYTILENNSVKTILDRLDIADEGTSITLVLNWVQVRTITVTDGNAYSTTLDGATPITEEETGTTVYLKGDLKDCKAVTGWTTVPANLVVTEVDGKPGYWQFEMPNVNVELEPVYGPSHTLVKTNAVAVTCTTAGTHEYWQCSVCNKYFNNEDGTLEHEISDITAWLAQGGNGYIAPQGHDFVYDRIEWTENVAKAICECSRCDAFEEHNCEMSHEVKTPATCENKGVTTYTATYLTHEDTKDIEDIAALGHDWVFKEFEWNGVTSAKAVFVCSHDETHEDKRIASINDEIITPATCEEKGTTRYTASYGSHSDHQDVQNINALGHDFKFDSIVWTGNTAKAHYICDNDHSHTEDYDCTVEHVEKTAPTCENKGVTTYTATYDTHSDSIDLEDIPATGHAWAFDSFVWTGEVAKAHLVCSNGCGETSDVDAEMSEVVNTPATVTTKGEKTVTATYETHSEPKVFEIPILSCVHSQKEHVARVDATCTETGTKEYWHCPDCNKYFSDEACTDEITNLVEWKSGDGVIAATGHDFGEVQFKWSGTNCTGYRVCSHNENHRTYETVNGHYEKVVDATCTTPDVGKLTATFVIHTEFGTAVLNDYVKPDSEPLGHNYVFKEIVWTDLTAKAVYECSRNHSHTEEHTCAVTSEITTVATCTTAGVITYTATYDSQSSTKNVEYVDLLNHTLNHVNKVDATHDAEGHTEYYECSGCHKLFSDQTAQHEISQASTVIPKLVRITVHGASISNATGNVLDLKPGDKVVIDANAPEEGKEFKGWALSEGGAIISTNESIEITIGLDIAYYAVYGDIEKPSGLPLGALIGIIAGSVVLVAGGAVLTIMLLKKKKKTQA